MNRAWFGALPFAIGLACAAQGCSSGHRDLGDEAPRTTTSPILGGDAKVDTFNTALPVRAVGRIDRITPGGDVAGCSGSLIQRNVVLFAAHCICRDIRVGSGVGGISLGSSWRFHLPYMKAGKAVEPGPDPSIDYPPFAGGITGTGLVSYFIHPSKCDPDLDSRPITAARGDLAVMILSRAITPAELPEIQPVYTSGDFEDRIFNLKTVATDPLFFQRPVFLVGWTGTNIKTSGTLQGSQTLRFVHDDGGPAYLKYHSGDTYTTSVLKGDSGGPMTFMDHGTTATEIGVAATILDYPSGDDFNLHSPTWDTGYGNGAFLRTFLEDGDNDGVLDTFDNCPPSRCTYPEQCANPDQVDGDGDSVGDKCDNCAPSRCTAQGWPASACFNKFQDDGDGDRVGDVCDNCPESKDFNQYDADGDGVGSCDNCQGKKNGFKACLFDADCTERRPGGASTGVVGTCINERGYGPLIFGKCGDGLACLADKDCSSGTCNTNFLYGRCSRQLDDWDHDLVGASCDSCPSVSNATAQADSNLSRETNLGVQELGDRCDPVPVYLTRPIVAVPSGGSYKTITEITGAAGIGSATDVPSRSFNGTVVFRHCDCLTAGGDIIDDVACRASGSCSTDPHALATASWTPVTIGTSKSVVPAAGVEISRTFRDTIDCSDESLHPGIMDGLPNPDGITDEKCHVGPVENLYWFHDVDVKAGRVRPFGTTAIGTKTAGLLSTQVPVSSLVINGTPVDDNYASPRDRASGGELRYNFQYIVTPLFNAGVLFEPPMTVPRDKFDHTVIFRPDVGGGPFVDPPGDGPMAFLKDSAALVSFGGRMLAFNGPQNATIDVSSALSQTTRSILEAPGLSWFTPVEAGGRGSVGGTSLAMVAVPTDWKQAFGAPVAMVLGRDGLRVAGEHDGQHLDLNNQNVAGAVATNSGSLFNSLLHPNNGVSQTQAYFVPGDRTGARGIVSVTRQSFFLVGGRRDGEITGEIWQYGFGSGEWNRVFGAGKASPMQTPDAIGVGDVLAATYDDLRDRMFAIDDVPETLSENTLSRGARNNARKTTRRLVAFDMQTEIGRAYRLPPGARNFTRFDLVAREDGSVIAIGQRQGAPRWKAFRLTMGGSGAPVWTKFARGTGTVVEGAHNTPLGVVVPVVTSPNNGNGNANGSSLSLVRLDHARCNAPALDNQAEPDGDVD